VYVPAPLRIVIARLMFLKNMTITLSILGFGLGFPQKASVDRGDGGCEQWGALSRMSVLCP